MDKVTQVKIQFRLEQWKKLISECQASGLSVCSWCQQNDVREQTYYYYLKKIREQTIENLLTQGLFSAERVAELDAYASVLDDDSVAPKAKIKEAIQHIRDEQMRIAQYQAEAQMMQQRAQQFLMEDPDGQAQQIADARMQLMMQQEQPIEGEAEVKAAEEEQEENCCYENPCGPVHHHRPQPRR